MPPRTDPRPEPGRLLPRTGVLLLGLTCLSASHSRSDPQVVAQPAPRVSASVGVTVLDLDVVATEDGRPVRDLCREKVVVKVGGRVLPVDLFSRYRPHGGRFRPPVDE